MPAPTCATSCATRPPRRCPARSRRPSTAARADRAISGIHDIAFSARVREIEGRGEVRGAEMLVGGGTSIMPRMAPVLYEFVELDNGDYLKIAEAVFRIFDRQEWLRANRARARIKVFVDKYGIDELRNQVEEELKGDWVAERDFSIEHRLFLDDEREAAPAPPQSYGSPQRRPLGVRALPRGQRGRAEAGRLRDGRGRRSPAATSRPSSSAASRRSCANTPAAMRARPCSRTSCCGGCARSACTTSGERCRSSDSAMPARARSATWSRALAPTRASWGSPARWASIRPSRSGSKRWSITDALTRRLNIKISGCPNGCGQHHVGSIGFTGASIKVGEHTIPAYIPHVGGVFEGGQVKFGTRLKLRLPSKRVPEAVDRWVRHYEASRHDGEEWTDFVERVGTSALEALVKDLSMPVDFGLETMNEFIDWNRSVPFEVIRGEGECAV